MDSSVTIALMVFLVVAATVAVVGAAASRFLPNVRRDRLIPGAVSSQGTSILRWTAPRAWWQRIVEAVGQRTAPREAQNISKLRQKLGWAGYHAPTAVTIYTGSRFVLALVLVAIYPVGNFILGQSGQHPYL